MRKIYLPLVLVLMSIAPAFCQDTLKITKGGVTTELNINPFLGDLSLNNAFNQIKIRYFTSDLSALRLAFTYKTNNLISEQANPYSTNPYNLVNNRYSTTMGLNFGYEKHFVGTRRLSPYLGMEVSLAKRLSSHTHSVNNNETKVKGAWLNYTALGQEYTERAYFSYGLNLITGFDFYIAQHFYFGYEMGFGFSNFNYRDVDVTTISSGTGGGGGNIYNTMKDRDFILGPNMVNGIRLGFVF